MKLIIVGGGASGLVAAVAAARASKKGSDILLLESGAKPGRKILSTGNGHCNMTNEKALPMAYHSDNAMILDDLLARFSYRDVLDFFNELGIPSVSRDGYYYPKNKEASSIRDALVSEVQRLGVRIFPNTKIVKAEKNADCFVLTDTEGREYRGDRVILAAGGMAFPKSGSDGSGYNLAMDLGHSIVQPLPGLVALTAEENWVKNFAGVRLDGTVTLQVDGIRRRSQQGEIQLTDYGISGIPIFQLSGDAVDALSQNKKTAILLNFWDNKTETDILFALKMRCKARPDWETGGQWEYDGTVKGGGKAHTENRNVNQKPDMSKWNLPGARINGKPEETPSTDHTENRNDANNKKAEVSKWNFPGAKNPKENNPSVDHPSNRNIRPTKTPSKWEFPKNDNVVSGVQHTENRNMNTKATPSKWNFPGAGDDTSSVDHTSNRSVNQAAEPSKWNYPGTKNDTASVDHTANRSVNQAADPSKWSYPGTEDGTASVEHTVNRSVNQAAEPSKWNYPGTRNDTASTDHTVNRSINQAAEPSKWSFPGSMDDTASVDHTANRSTNQKAEPSKWSYPGAEDGAASVDHTLNRNVNEKAEPVKWPPVRRALKAQALSEL